MGFLIAAYAFALVALGGYVVSLLVRHKRIDRRIMAKGETDQQ